MIEYLFNQCKESYGIIIYAYNILREKPWYSKKVYDWEVKFGSITL